uniref:Polyprotein n=1 Tax=Solanum tuberosum TaxID=4113 RepID=M1B5P6_SOLTU
MYDEKVNFLTNQGGGYRSNYPRKGGNQGWVKDDGWKDRNPEWRDRNPNWKDGYKDRYVTPTSVRSPRIRKVVEGDKNREQAKETKKARTGNYEYSQLKSGGGNCSLFQQKCSTTDPSSASVPSPRFCNNHKVRVSGSKSQGSVSGTKTYPTCPKCNKNHPGECLVGGGQRQNRLYALQARQDQEDSPDVVTVQFSVSPETLSEPLLVSTQVGDPVIVSRVYRNCPVKVSQKVTSADLIELEMNLMQISKTCRCNPRLLPTDRRVTHGPCWWSVVCIYNHPQKFRQKPF